MTESRQGIPLTADAFEARLEEEFVFGRPEGGEARLKLISLRRLPRHELTDREPFSMIFVMKDQEPLGPGLHRLLHPDLESFDMFISRVTVPRLQKADPAGMFYEAIFN